MINHLWEKKFPLHEREANWAKYWSKWTNKTRKQIVELTYDLEDFGHLQDNLDETVRLKQKRFRNAKRGG